MRNDDHPHDECGVFGVIEGSGADVATTTFFGLYNLQHRGQESAGIAVSDGAELRSHKSMGLVNQVFNKESLERLPGWLSLGHPRYSTTGSSIAANAQPICVKTDHGPIAVAHNGNIVNTRELRERLYHQGVRFETTNDSEVLARCIGSLYQGDIVEAVRQTMLMVRGAYSVGLITLDKLVGFRDPDGIRPLCLATSQSGGFVISSETCALGQIGAELHREIEPGEMVVADRDGVEFTQVVPMNSKSMCLFEFIYLARPDSKIYGKGLHPARMRMGQQLAHEHPAPGATLVVPVPDTGIPAAIGFSQASGIPYGEGLIKNRYIGRTFIEPDQRLRELGVRMKLSPLRENLAGQKVVLVDDSIVRGTTTGQIVRLIRDAGAAEVHVRISAPPVKWPCFYGIDMADQEHLIAARLKYEEKIRAHIGADSLGYLSVNSLPRVIGVRKDAFCTACFTGHYPILPPEELKLSKLALELHDGELVDIAGEPHDDLLKVVAHQRPLAVAAAPSGSDGGDPPPSLLGIDK